MSDRPPGDRTRTWLPDETADPWHGPIPPAAAPAAQCALRILILEDEPSDAELEQRLLKRAGLDFLAVVVDTEEAFLQQLDAFRPELILSDFSLPGFSGEKASRSPESDTRTCRSSSCQVHSETKQRSSSSGRGRQTMC